VQSGHPQLANFQSLDFCATDDEAANRYESDRDCAQRYGAYSNCADCLRAYGQGANRNWTEASWYFLDFI
jgi:hypothetical protein